MVKQLTLDGHPAQAQKIDRSNFCVWSQLPPISLISYQFSLELIDTTELRLNLHGASCNPNSSPEALMNDLRKNQRKVKRETKSLEA